LIYSKQLVLLKYHKKSAEYAASNNNHNLQNVLKNAYTKDNKNSNIFCQWSDL